MNLSFELDIFNESVDPVQRIGLNDWFMNLIDMVLTFSVNGLVHHTKQSYCMSSEDLDPLTSYYSYKSFLLSIPTQF